MSSPSINSLESPLPAKRIKVKEEFSPAEQIVTRPQHYFESKTKEIHFYHEWIIENFSYYCLNENDSDHFPVIYSSNFSSPSNDKLQFRLELFPNGFDELGKGNVSLYLELRNCDRNEIVLKYEFWIIDSDGFKRNSYNSKQKFSKYTSCNWGTGKLCALKDILDSVNKLIPGDTLTIVCEISYEQIGDENLTCEEIALMQLKNVCLQLKQNDTLADVGIVFGEDEVGGKDNEVDNEVDGGADDDGDLGEKIEFAVHKAILGARSEVFADMFDKNEEEEIGKQRLIIPEVDVKVGEELLKYLYGDIPFFDTNAVKLLPIADKYQLHSLKSICEGALCFRINPESVGNLLLLADIHNSELLKSSCVEYIQCYRTCVLESESMKKLMVEKPDFFYETFKDIPEDTPEDLFTCWSPPTVTVDPFMTSWSYTGSSVIKYPKRWTIDNFYAHHFTIGKYLHDSIDSPPFSSSQSATDSPVQFVLKLYTHGEDVYCSDHLSLYLELKCDEKMKVAVKVRVSIVVNDNSAKGYTMEIGKKLSNGESVGWPRFIAIKKLMENNKLLLNGIDDQLVLLCEVFYIENIDEPETVSGLNTFAKEHEFSIAHDLSNLYQSGKLTDAVFALGDKEFSVHKSIVSSRSEVFSRMFVHANRIQIDDVSDVDTFERMLALVYGQTEGLTEWAHKMLPLLEKYEMNSLTKVCQLVLCDQLDDENVADLVMLADKHNATMLKSKAFEYIRSKYSLLTKNDTLKAVRQNNSKLFYEVFLYKYEN